MTTPLNITDLLSDDASTCATIGPKAMTADQLLDLMNALMPERSPKTPDVFLMTYRTEWAVKKALRSADDVCSLPRREMPFSLFGIPFESYPTMEDVSLRAIELTMNGKVVSVLEDAA